MTRSILAMLVVCLLGLCAPALRPVSASAQTAQSFLSLSGRWAGMGTIVPTNGPSEDFKCVITYFPSEDGTRVKQNLRCQGPSQRFDAATHLELQGNEISGRWEENIYSLNGTVNGAITDEGFVVVLSGDFFEARMTVISSRCEQSVTLIPERASQMKQLAATLRKC